MRQPHGLGARRYLILQIANQDTGFCPGVDGRTSTASRPHETRECHRSARPKHHRRQLLRVPMAEKQPVITYCPGHGTCCLFKRIPCRRPEGPPSVI